MFAEAIYIYLSSNFEDKFQVSSKHCIVVDVLAKKEVTYKNLIDNKVPAVLESTLEQIKQLV